ncbi:hypothetical protein [Streptomyces sp. KAU_LT]|uniref:VMAP-C domain-containing protein n=1 Tax=Streptomyces sp. KAU_LT TaxID=3046669 RepID=UPI0024B68B58|nr:hypothetical protein [Streptomyces sp. KAU_LT]MDI9836168.1 hypothetical protein [Streptomyces sp. KAU_LT]
MPIWRHPLGGLRRGGRPSRWKAERQLVEILLGTAGLHELAARQELLLLTGERLAFGHALLAPEHPDPRTHLRAVVRATRDTERLAALRDALLELRGDDIGAAWFRLAATTSIRPDGPVPGHCMSDLIAELREHPEDFGRGAATRYLSDRRAAGRPLDCRPLLPDVMFRLYDARRPAGGPDTRHTDLCDFLRMLDAESGRTGRLGTLIAAVVRNDRDRHRGPQAGPTATAPQERRVVIQIRVEEEDAPCDEPLDRRHYSLRGFHYESGPGDKPVFHCSWPLSGRFTGDELEARGRDFLATWRGHEHDDWEVNRRVEFLLPDSLLGHPAELWPSGSSGKPLSRRCHVVVRSLRRYKDTSLHGEWRRRWAALDRDCAPGDALERIGWMRPDLSRARAETDVDCRGTAWSCPDSKYEPLRLRDPADVEDWLRQHIDLACLGLGTPYDPGDPLVREAVTDALLEDGIPVMIWRRDEGDAVDFVDLLRRVRPPGLLAELPDSVLEARRHNRTDTASLGHHITLLWDDPTCVFSSQDGQMPGIRGAGGGAA